MNLFPESEYLQNGGKVNYLSRSDNSDPIKWSLDHFPCIFLGVRRSSLNIELSVAKGWTCY